MALKRKKGYFPLMVILGNTICTFQLLLVSTDCSLELTEWNFGGGGLRRNLVITVVTVWGNYLVVTLHISGQYFVGNPNTCIQLEKDAGVQFKVSRC